MLAPVCTLVLSLAPCAAPADPPNDAARAPVVAPRPTGPGAAGLARLAERLGDGDYAVRSAAAAALSAAGPRAADVLTDAARSDDPERRTRATALLAAGHARGVRRRDRDAVAAFGGALMELAYRHPPGVTPDGGAAAPPPPNDAAAAATATLERFPGVVRDRAVAELRSRGAAVMDSASPFGAAERAVQVTLDERWSGGADGLLFLKAVPSVQTLYLTDKVPLPAEARAALQAGGYGVFPIERRGEAFLGITFDAGAGGGGCQIDGVHPGSPADRAGLRSGDLVRKFGDVEVTGPGVLLDAIREQGTPGEPTPVVVRRIGRDEFTVQVTLARWPDGARLPPRRFPPGFNPARPFPALPPIAPPPPARVPGDDTDD